ncbi:hypothetical protein ACP4OV_022052 [Aristida adscensionis]
MAMATHPVSSLLLLLLQHSFVLTLAAAQPGDETALLAFKAAASSGGVLASWNGSTGGYCSWEGVRCRGRGRHRRVVALNLPNYGLTGVLSPAAGNLSSLRYLNLSSNGLSGDIPASLGRLHRLHALELGHNAFSGEIPANLSYCTNLMIMTLESNKLHGHIPHELGDKLMRLEWLSLWKNNFTGSIPKSLANMSSLTVISIGLNQLEGTIPPGLGGILDLWFLDLAFNNLSGEPPLSLYNLSKLDTFEIQGNMLQGSIPDNIGMNFPKMSFLSFSTNRLSDLQELYLQVNKLETDDKEGFAFITSLSNCSNLLSLVIGNNSLTGHLPSTIANLSVTLQFLVLSDTGISGRIPSAIGNLVNLEEFTVANTSISGVVPETIGKLGNLVRLKLYNTDMTGQIPSSIGNLSRLSELYAANSKLEGAIPASLGQLKNLIVLDLYNNRLNSSIPREIFKLPLLSSYLDLSYNSLSGPLPSEVGSLHNLNQLLLSGNQLSGEMPDSIGQCTVLEDLWLDNNSFQGGIPLSLTNLKGLKTLNLSMNKLSGNIPDGIGSIRNLQQLDLAHNNLSGPIPTVLQHLTSLIELDVSFNNLQGEVPKDGIFRNLTGLSITGNNELCGGINQLHLAPCQTNYTTTNMKGWSKPLTIALAATGAILFLAFIFALQFICKKLRRKQKSLCQPPVDEEQYGRVSYHEIATGTNGFSEANLLGTGSFGAVYKCTLEDEGTITAVKVFNLKQSGSTRSFLSECEALRRVRHRCLVKIITCCSSINHEGQEFKALVFEFMPNGSLNVWLHPEFGMPNPSKTLSLAQRLNIAVDIMDALDYLHNHCQPPIVHCDLKPSNILLADDMSARVGDFGISRILPHNASKSPQNSSSTIGIRGSIGYVAPEYGEGSSASTLGDVYSLGILLLEMFTGRSPTDDMFQGSLDLHKFSEDALPDRIWEIADPSLWIHTNACKSTVRSGIQNCLASAVALGISCSKKQPAERIPIQDAVTKMHAIRDSYLKLARSPVMENGIAQTLQ